MRFARERGPKVKDFLVSSPGERDAKRVAELRLDCSPEKKPPEPPPGAGDSESESDRMNYSPSDEIHRLATTEMFYKKNSVVN